MDRGDPLLSISEAAQCLRAGEVIAYPTEAVYGLGCDPDSESAVRRILELKKRPAAAGLILIADSFDRLGRYVARVPRDLLDRALATWPGHVTWLFPRADGVPDWLAGDHPTIAIRVTAHPVCRDLCAAFGGALVSTSANPRSEDPAQSVGSVRRYFGADIAGVVAGQLGGDARPSEIRDLATGRVIRGG
jgi:L-threonylcarbamoyladenylate synthase